MLEITGIITGLIINFIVQKAKKTGLNPKKTIIVLCFFVGLVYVLATTLFSQIQLKEIANYLMLALGTSQLLYNFVKPYLN